MTTRNEKPQTWGFETASIAGITLALKIPQDPTRIGEQGEVDLPVGRISLTADVKILLDNVTLPVADISNLITAGYRHLVLGGAIAEDVDRGDAIAKITKAMKVLNYTGAVAIIKETHDSGQFEFAGNTVTFQRMVSAGTVTTSYNTQTLATQDGSIRNGTWSLLTAEVANVLPAKDEYEVYAKALAGEDVDTAKE